MNERSTREWILKAESDWKVGRDEFATKNPMTDAVCFHMQQCAEKYLKAFLVFHGRELKRTHVLEELIRLCAEIDPEFMTLFEAGVHRLTDYAVTMRYPGDVLFPPLEEAREAITLAERVRDFVRKKLVEKGFRL